MQKDRENLTVVSISMINQHIPMNTLNKTCPVRKSNNMHVHQIIECLHQPNKHVLNKRKDNINYEKLYHYM